MDPLSAAVIGVVGMLFNAFAIPWLMKRRKLDGAELLLMVASGAMALVLKRNPDFKGLVLLDAVIAEMKKQFPKTNPDVLSRAAADVLARAGM